MGCTSSSKVAEDAFQRLLDTGDHQWLHRLSHVSPEQVDTLLRATNITAFSVTEWMLIFSRLHTPCSWDQVVNTCTHMLEHGNQRHVTACFIACLPEQKNKSNLHDWGPLLEAAVHYWPEWKPNLIKDCGPT